MRKKKQQPSLPAPLPGVAFTDRVPGQCAMPLWASPGRPSLTEMRYCGEPCLQRRDAYGKLRFSPYCADCAEKLHVRSAGQPRFSAYVLQS